MSLINNINIRILRWLHVNVNDIEWEKPNGIRDGSFHVNSCYTAPTDGKHVLDENMFWEKNDLRINITTFDLYSAWKIRQQAFSTICHCGNILQCKRGFKHFVHFFPLFSVYYCLEIGFQFYMQKNVTEKWTTIYFTRSWRNTKNFNLNNTIPCYEVRIISRTSYTKPKNIPRRKIFFKVIW